MSGPPKGPTQPTSARPRLPCSVPFDLRLCARSYDDLAAPNLRGRAGVFPCRRTAKNLLKMPPTFWPSLPDPNGPVSPGARALSEQLDKALTGSA